MGFTRNIGRCSATMAELESILDGPRIAWSLNTKNVILETFSKEAIQEIQAIGEKQDCSVVMHTIKDLFYVFREGNRIVNGLAKMTFSALFGKYIFKQPPNEIFQILHEVLLSVM